MHPVRISSHGLFGFLIVLSFALSAAPVPADTLEMIKSLPLHGDQTRIVKSGNLLYLAAGTSGVNIVDVTNPASPTLWATLDTSGTAQGLAVSDSRLFIADGATGLLVADVANPASPAIVGAYDTPGDARSVVTSGTLALVADGPRGLQIFDASQPARPVKVGSYDHSLDASDLELQGRHAVLAGGNALTVLDLSDLAAPQQLGQCSVSPAVRLCVGANEAYVCKVNFGVSVVDLSDPAYPKYLTAAAFGGGSKMNAVLDGTMLFVAEYASGVEMVDVSAPSLPAPRGITSTGGNATDLAVHGDLVYVANGTGGLAIMRRRPQPFLHVLAPNGKGRNIQAGAPYLVRWDSDNVSGTVTIRLDYLPADGTPEYQNTGVPVTQGNSGFSINVPAGYPHPGSGNVLTIVADNGSTSANTGNITVNAGNDVTSPGVSIATSSFYTYTTEKLLVNGSSSDGQSGIERVEARVNGGPWIRAQVINNMWWALMTLASGQNRVEARATDYAGNKSSIPGILAAYNPTDIVPPRIQVAQPQDLSRLTGTCTLNLSGTASDPGPITGGVAAVEVQQNGQGWKTLGGTTSWSGQIKLVRGLNILEFRSRDYRTNTSPITSMNIFYDPPLTRPTVAIGTPAYNQALPAGKVAVNGTATPDGMPIDRVEFRVNGGAWKPAQGTASWSAEGDLVDGINRIEARAMDAYNNESAIAGINVLAQSPASNVVVPSGVIGGACRVLAMDGNTVYMSEGTRLLALDVSDPANIRQLAAIPFSTMIHGVTLEGGKAYVAAGDAGLFIYDVRNPAAPQWLGGFRAAYPVYTAAVSGTTAYVGALGSYGCQIAALNVTDPARPVQTGSLVTYFYNYVYTPKMRLQLIGPRLYVSWAGSNLRIYDVSNPASIKESGVIDNIGAPAFAVMGYKAYIASGTRLYWYDVTTPAAPKQLGSLNLTKEFVDLIASSNRVHGLTASGTISIYYAPDPAQGVPRDFQLGAEAAALYVSGARDYAATAQGLKVINNAVETNPTLAATVSVYDARKVRVSGSLAVVQDGEHHLRLYDITNPRSPVLRGTPLALNGSIADFVIQGDIIYVGSGYSTTYLSVVSMGGGTGLSLQRQVDGVYGRGTENVAFSGGRLYLAGTPALRVFGCSNPTSPTLLGTYNANVENPRIDVSGNIAVLAYRMREEYSFKADVLDVANPAKIRLLGTSDLVDPPLDVQLNGKYVYISCRDTYNSVRPIKALDLTDPANPAEVSVPTITEYPGELASYGNRLYLVDTTGKLRILLLDATGKFVLERSLSTDQSICSVTASDKAALAACRFNGLKVFDLAYQHNEYRLGGFDTIGVVDNVTAGGGSAWLAVNGRLHVVDISNPAQPVRRASLNMPDTFIAKIIGNRLFAFTYPAPGQSRVALFNASDPAHPVLLGSFATRRSPLNLAVAGNLVYISEDSLVEIVDWTDPARPRQFSEIAMRSTNNVTPGRNIGLIGSTLVVTNGDPGLMLVNVGCPAVPLPTLMFDATGFHPYMPFNKPGLQGIGNDFPISQMAVDWQYIIITSRYRPSAVLHCRWPSEAQVTMNPVKSDVNYSLVAASGGRVALGPSRYGSPAGFDLYTMTAAGTLEQRASQSVPELRQMTFAGNTLCVAGGQAGLRLFQVGLEDNSAVENWCLYQ